MKHSQPACAASAKAFAASVLPYQLRCTDTVNSGIKVQGLYFWVK